MTVQDRIPVGAKFSAPARSVLGPTQPPIQWVPCPSWGVKRPGRGVDHPSPYSPEVKESVELYLYSTSGPSACSRVNLTFIYIYTHTGYTQKNGAVSKVNKTCISHLTRAQRTPSAAASFQVCHVLITILQRVHPGSHDTHPHGNQIHPRLGVACPL